MDINWLILAVALLSALAFFQNLINLYKPKHKLPPGPRPWPIIGNLTHLGSIPHQSLHLLSKKYGEIMGLKFGSRHVVVASSPYMAKQFLQVHDHVFASRPATAAGKYASYNFSDMTWAPYGPHWRQARRIYANGLFSPKRLASFEHVRTEETRGLISRIYGLSGKAVVIKDHLREHSLSTISRIAFSGKYFGDGSSGSVATLEELQGMLDKWFLLNGVFNIGDWIPWLGFLDLQGYVKQMKDLGRSFDRFHNYVIDDHIAKRNVNSVQRDMVDVLLKLAEDPNLEVQLSKDCIKGLMQDLLAGGTDTSAATVEWAIHELIKQPQIINKATQEIDAVIGRDRWVQESDFPNLPYLESVIKETLRLHPLATLLAPHYAMEDCSVSGYDISKGTTIIVNAWSIGRDPKSWDSPEDFIPERFMGKEIDMLGKNFELLPFGSGRRRCPGYGLGLKMVRSTLANLLHGFRWRLPEGLKNEDVSMEEVYGLTTHPKVALAIIMEPRLPVHLYHIGIASPLIN